MSKDDKEILDALYDIRDVLNQLLELSTDHRAEMTKVAGIMRKHQRKIYTHQLNQLDELDYDCEL